MLHIVKNKLYLQILENNKPYRHIRSFSMCKLRYGSEKKDCECYSAV